jgi:hypothetical protein
MVMEVLCYAVAVNDYGDEAAASPDYFSGL